MKQYTHQIFHVLYLKIKQIGLALLFGLMTVTSTSQTLEIGALVGGSAYVGDLASREWPIIPEQINSGIGGFLRYNFNDQLSLKLQVLSSQLEADDKRSSFDRYQQRNLRFFSPLMDASLRAEWHFLETIFKTEGVVSPYISLGGSFFTFNPQATYQGTTYELQPLSTEGQGLSAYPDKKRYELYSFTALIGGGITFKINDDFHIAIDVVSHAAFTDYIDDVSDSYVDYGVLLTEKGVVAANIAYQADDFFGLEQSGPIPGTGRGNPKYNDFYVVGGITLSYALINPYRTTGRRGQIGCPTF